MLLVKHGTEWPSACIKELCSKVTSGGTPSRSTADFFVPAGIPWVKTKELEDRRIYDTEEHITDEALNRSAAKLLPADTVLVAMYGATAGRLGILGTQMSCNQACCALVPDTSKVNPRYLFYALLAGREKLISLANGAAQQNLNTQMIASSKIPAPALAEQGAIASILGAIDDKIAMNDQIISASLDLAQAVFESVAADHQFGTETFGSLAAVNSGGTPSTSEPAYWNGGIPWTTPSDVTALNSPYLFRTARTISECGLANCASLLYPRGSIFMTSRATIGSFAVAQVPAAVNQGFIVVVPPDESRWWLFHEMNSRVDEMLSFANGSTFLELGRKNFKAMPVRVPPTEILMGFDAKVSPLHQRAARSAQESTTLAELRDTLLPKLMSGEIRIKDVERAVDYFG